jgi:hypothetical protein
LIITTTKEGNMTNWSDLEIYGLADFDFGVSTGWRVSGPKKLVRKFETPTLIAEAVARPLDQCISGSRTTTMFEADQILPAIIAAQIHMESLGWPSRKKDPASYAIWNKARTAQAKIFKGLVTQLQEESPEFSTVLDGKGGWLAAHGRKDPQLWREPLIIPVAVGNIAKPMWVESITIHKRYSELDQGNITQR